MKAAKNIVIVGVGGQGILLISDVAVQVALEEGYDVKKSEVHGMAQRGGSVISEVRFGEVVYSPLVRKGTADIMIALERLEAARFSDYLAPQAVAVVNDLAIAPLGVSLGKERYPADVFKYLTREGLRLVRVGGADIARSAGNMRTVNVALLGIASSFMPFSQESWEEQLTKRVPRASLSANLRAFQIGRLLGEKEAV